MLETIRQFAEEQLAATGTSTTSGIATPAISPLRPRPTGTSGTGPASRWRWTGWRPSTPICGPGSAGPPTATTSTPPPHRRPHHPARRACCCATKLVGWATEILAAATAADVPAAPPVQRGLLLLFTRADRGRRGLRPYRVALATDARYDPFEPAWTTGLRRWPSLSGTGGGSVGDRRGPRRRTRARRTPWASRDAPGLPSVGRADEARALADEALSANRAHGNPDLVANTPHRVWAGVRRHGSDQSARRSARGGRVLARASNVICGGAPGPRSRWPRSRPRRPRPSPRTARQRHRPAAPSRRRRQPGHRLRQSRRLIRPPPTTRDRRHPLRRQPPPWAIGWVTHLDAVIEHLRVALGDITFDHCADTGAAMEISDAATYARRQIRLTDLPPADTLRPPPASTNNDRFRSTNDRIDLLLCSCCTSPITRAEWSQYTRETSRDICAARPRFVRAAIASKRSGPSLPENSPSAGVMLHPAGVPSMLFWDSALVTSGD